MELPNSVQVNQQSRPFCIENPLRHIQLKIQDPFGTTRQKKKHELVANQYDDVTFAVEKNETNKEKTLSSQMYR